MNLLDGFKTDDFRDFFGFNRRQFYKTGETRGAGGGNIYHLAAKRVNFKESSQTFANDFLAIDIRFVKESAVFDVLKRFKGNFIALTANLHRLKSGCAHIYSPGRLRTRHTTESGRRMGAPNVTRSCL